MLLTDTLIREQIDSGRVIISPFDEALIGPASYHLRLGDSLLVPEAGAVDIEGRVPGNYKRVEIGENGYQIPPGGFILAETLEVVTLPNDIGALIDGRTTLARLGLSIHQSAIFIEPGHADSIITLEISNASPFEITLDDKIPIAKLVFIKSEKPAQKGYADIGRYPKQDGVLPAKL